MADTPPLTAADVGRITGHTERWARHMAATGKIPGAHKPATVPLPIGASMRQSFIAGGNRR